MSSWIKKAQDDLLPPPDPKIELATGGDPSMGTTEGLDLKPLSELEKTEADPIPNPTGDPDPIDTISLKELGDLMGSAGKSLQECLKDIQNANTSISKLLTMGGHTEKDSKIRSQAEELSEKLGSLRTSAEELAGDVARYRDEASSPDVTQPENEWLSPLNPDMDDSPLDL